VNITVGLHVDTASKSRHSNAGRSFSDRQGGPAQVQPSAAEGDWMMKGIRMTKQSMLLGVAVLALFGLPQVSAAQDVSAGETSFKKCMPCHDIGPDARNKVGPVLNGLDGRKSGTAPDYNYSDANKNSGITWNEASFKEYIADPRGKIQGTKMIFPGIKNPQEVDNLWAYIKQFNADGSTK
jgi:cytochrome c